jgi:hypothetical protein
MPSVMNPKDRGVNFRPARGVSIQPSPRVGPLNVPGRRAPRRPPDQDAGPASVPHGGPPPDVTRDLRCPAAQPVGTGNVPHGLVTPRRRLVEAPAVSPPFSRGVVRPRSSHHGRAGRRVSQVRRQIPAPIRPMAPSPSIRSTTAAREVIGAFLTPITTLCAHLDSENSRGGRVSPNTEPTRVPDPPRGQEPQTPGPPRFIQARSNPPRPRPRRAAWRRRGAIAEGGMGRGTLERSAQTCPHRTEGSS